LTKAGAGSAGVEAGRLAVIFVILIIPIVIAVPMVVMLYPAAATFPIAGVEALAVVARRYPPCAFIRWPSPVSLMPSITTPLREPVTVYPNKIAPGHSWA
jgi:hypothetical protein